MNNALHDNIMKCIVHDIKLLNNNKLKPIWKKLWTSCIVRGHWSDITSWAPTCLIWNSGRKKLTTSSNTNTNNLSSDLAKYMNLHFDPIFEVWKKLITSCNLEVKRIKYVFLTVFLLPRMRHDGIRCACVFRTGQQAPIPILGCGPTVWPCLSLRNTSSMGAYIRTQFPY